MKRGDLVPLDYPYTNGSGSKVRPALIVQNDRDNQLLTNTIVALITKNVSRVQEPTQFLIDLATPDGRQSGLNQNSAVTCSNLFTVARTKVRRVIGSLPASAMARIDDCLITALGLPWQSQRPSVQGFAVAPMEGPPSQIAPRRFGFARRSRRHGSSSCSARADRIKGIRTHRCLANQFALFLDTFRHQ